MDLASLFEELYGQAAERNHKGAFRALKDLKPCVDIYLSLGLEPSASARECIRNGIFELGEILAEGWAAKSGQQVDPNKLRRLVLLLEHELDSWLIAPKIGVLA